MYDTEQREAVSGDTEQREAVSGDTEQREPTSGDTELREPTSAALNPRRVLAHGSQAQAGPRGRPRRVLGGDADPGHRTAVCAGESVLHSSPAFDSCARVLHSSLALDRFRSAAAVCTAAQQLLGACCAVCAMACRRPPVRWTCRTARALSRTGGGARRPPPHPTLSRRGGHR